MGVDTPDAVAPIDTAFVAAQSVAQGKNSKVEDFRGLDSIFSDSISKTSAQKAYASLLSDEFRIHRRGLMPITNKASFEKLTTYPTRFEFIDGKIASSKDLAFTYGKYTAADETGYYVHVWRTDKLGTACCRCAESAPQKLMFTHIWRAK